METTTLCFTFLFLMIASVSSFSFTDQDVQLNKLLDDQEKLKSKILQDSIVKKVNENPDAGWEAAMNPKLENYTVGQFKYMLGVKPTPEKKLMGVPVIRHPKSLKLPKEFDARTKWSQCPSIGRISDQGHCGSSWAFAAVETLSDRFCIHWDVNVSLSVNDLLACCGSVCGEGCGGGFPILAWKYFVYQGVVTEECDPYFDQTGCSHPGCEPRFPTPQCSRKCVDKNQNWDDSKHYCDDAYAIASDPDSIMAEVYTDGPVEVEFTLYQDFAHYKSGIYKHITGDVIGERSAKLIGWGTSDAGEDYWLLTNSWNRGWGDDGFFKIRRGTNECGIEDRAVAGLPSIKNLVRDVVSKGDMEYASAY